MLILLLRSFIREERRMLLPNMVITIFGNGRLKKAKHELNRAYIKFCLEIFENVLKIIRFRNII